MAHSTDNERPDVSTLADVRGIMFDGELSLGGRGACCSFQEFERLLWE